jgi:GT2 family glycosyltransferase
MPRISVILPIYQSQATLAGCLEALGRQTFTDIEVIAVDSSPDEACAEIAARFPSVTYLRARERLLPHAACNRGIEVAQGDLLAFTDPDSYARPDWLEQMLRGSRDGARVCVGAVACFGNRWLDLGAHLCKFDKWLPMMKPRRLREGPTVNLLLSREMVLRAGGRFHSELHGDTDLCWRLTRSGVEIWSVPQAVVEHHHLHSWRSLMAERRARGAGFADLRIAWESPGLAALGLRLAFTVLPLRLLGQLWRAGRNALRGRMGRAYLISSPVVVTGLYSGLWGEAGAIFRHLLRPEDISGR